MTVHRTKRLCKDDDDAEGDIAKEVDEHVHVEQSTHGEVAKTLRFPEATTCTSSPRASPVSLSEGQCCILDEPFCGFLSPIQSNGGELLERAFINTVTHSRNVVTYTQRNMSRSSEGNSQPSNVKLSISYPSKVVNKSLHRSYQLIGKALVHGVPSRITNAAKNCQPIRKHIVEKNTGYFEERSNGTLL